MKTELTLLFVIFSCCNLWAQTTIDVSTSKTVSLSFAAPIAHVDLGSAQIGAKLVGPGSKVVLVKALEVPLLETNLTVITAGDEVYTFNIRYNSELGRDNILVEPQAPTIANYAASILNNNRRTVGVLSNRDGLYAQVQGIYVRDSLLFFHLKVSNTTALQYDIEAIRFLLVNKKKGRRMAQQERSIVPVAFQGNHAQVPEIGSTIMVAVLPKFTLSNNQQLHIELIERGGNRNLRLKVAPRKLARAIVVPAL